VNGSESERESRKECGMWRTRSFFNSSKKEKKKKKKEKRKLEASFAP